MCQADDGAKCTDGVAPDGALQSGYVRDAEEEYDYAGLPHPEIRRLVDKLECGVSGLDEEVWLALKGYRATSRPTEYLDLALALVPENWWWHLSHLEASVIPTSPTPGAEGVLSNGRKYHKDGRPVSYRSMAHYARDQLPSALCAALLKAHYDLPPDFWVRESSLSDEPTDVIKARQERIEVFRSKARSQIEEPKQRVGDEVVAEDQSASLTHKNNLGTVELTDD